MYRHLTLTIENTPVGIDLMDLLEHEFRKFDDKRLEHMMQKSWICRWNGVSRDNAALITKSCFGKDAVGSISLALLRDANGEVAKSDEVRDGGRASEEVGESVVRGR